MTEDTKAKIKRLADAYADAAAFKVVTGASMTVLKRIELHAAIDSIDARGEAVAWVPVHPTNGPLWMNTTDDPSPERLPSYPLMPLYAAPLCASQDVPFKPETWAKDADGDAPQLCTVCGKPVRYGERHVKCASQDGGDALKGWKWSLSARYVHVAAPGVPAMVSVRTDSHRAADLTIVRLVELLHALRSPLPGRESTAQAGIAQSFGPVINPLTVLTTTAGGCATNTPATNGEHRNPFYEECFADETCVESEQRRHWATAARDFERAAAPNVLAMREALEHSEAALRMARKSLYSAGRYPESERAFEVAEQCHTALASPLPEPRAGEREGWKLVPIKPTEAMLEAMMDVKRRRMLDAVAAIKRGEDPDMIGHVEKSGTAEWRAALAASPIPTPEPQEGRDHG